LLAPHILSELEPCFIASTRRSRKPRLTLESNLVPLQTLHCLLEELLSTGRLSRNIILLPLNGHLQGLENLLDRVGDLLSDTVSGDERDGVFA
jgi:hypothetical protein